MKINKKIFIILLFAICIVSLLFGSVAYYRFLVSGSIEGSTGNAAFNVTGFKDDSSSIKTIELGKVSPGDSGEFTITLNARGSIVDMYATLSIDRGSGDTELPTNLKFYTTPDYKSELHKYYSFLETTGTQKEELTIYWYWNPFISDEDDNKYINREFSANIKVSAVQISEYAMMKNGYSGSREFWNSTYKPYIRTITFGNDLSNKPESCTGDADLCWDVSYDANQNKKVYAYLIDSGLKDSTDSTKALYNLYIVSDAPIFAPNAWAVDCKNIFNGFTNLTFVNFNNNFNTSRTRSFSYMFSNCKSLMSLDLSGFNTSNVTDMDYMFSSCKSLTNLDLSTFNTSHLTDMERMFSGCSLLTSLDLSNFNTRNVSRLGMQFMFYGCSSLTSLDLRGFNTSNVTTMDNMFAYCSSLTSLDLSSFNTSEVANMRSMFNGCKSLTNLDISNFNTSNVTTMYGMFSSCSSITTLNLSSFNTSNVTDMNNMFYGCSSITTLDLSNFNTSKVTDMSHMFQKCSSLISLDLSNFNTSNVTDMIGMFHTCTSLISLDLSSFDTSNVTNMMWMFYNCNKLQTQINIMNANTTNYSSMFTGALSDPDAYVILGYTTDTQSIVKAMRNTCNNGNSSKITLKII